MLNVGLVTGSVTPNARAAPLTSVVLPAPSSPRTSTTSPGRNCPASSAPSASVSAGAEVSRVGTWRTLRSERLRAKLLLVGERLALERAARPDSVGAHARERRRIGVNRDRRLGAAVEHAMD